MTRRRGVVIVFARAPRPGLVKTRMTPPLSPTQAAELYAELLTDVLCATAELAAELELEPVVTALPPEARSEIARVAPAAFRVIGQRGGDLAERMEWAVREAAAAGAERILLRGSDSPVIDAKIAGGALAALDAADVCVCPDRDGGYSLVGLTGRPRGNRMTSLCEVLDI